MTERERRFAMAFLNEANGDQTAAYKMSYSVENCKESSIHASASTVMARPAVRAFIEFHRQRVADKFEIGKLEVLRTWWTIATADPNELIQAQRRCCRYCHGIGFEYQWRDAQEWAEALAEELKAAEREKRAPVMIGDGGGFGFDHTAAPLVACPKCRGDGVVHVLVQDTRKLSPAGKLLYAGIKQTNHGIQVLMRSQDEALVNIAKAIGMFIEPDKGTGVAFNFNFTGKTTAAEATKLYKQLLG